MKRFLSISLLVMMILSLLSPVTVSAKNTKPKTPQKFEYRLNDLNQPKLSWKLDLTVAGYKLYRKGPTDKSYAFFTIVYDCKYTDITVEPGKKYSYMLKSYTKDKKAYTSDGATISVTIPKIPASNTRFVKNKDTGLSMLYTYKDNKLISTDYFDVEEVTTEKQAKKKTPLAREYYYYVTRKVDDPHKTDGSKISKTYRFQFASYDAAWSIYENDTNELYRKIELPEGEKNQDTTDIIPFWFDIFNTSYSKANKIFKKIISGEPDENKLYPLNDYFAFSWD